MTAPDAAAWIDLTAHPVGFIGIAIFVLAYVVVILEDHIGMRKSKPVTLAAGLIWALVAITYQHAGLGDAYVAPLRHFLLEFAELFLFLLVAMAYINTLEERRMFDALRAWMINAGLGYRGIFWVSGVIAFFLSAVADNLTTALVIGTIVLALGKAGGEHATRFIVLALVNVVVASNAGGAFSPFGDITTLMVWQKGLVTFDEFLLLFLPSLVNWLVPAIIMSFWVKSGKPEISFEHVEMLKGARRTAFFFVLTIITAVLFHSLLHLPPAIGMMTGLAYLKIFGWYLRKRLDRKARLAIENGEADDHATDDLGQIVPFDIFNKIARAEWDTLLFFYGIILCVGGLSFMGYLGLASNFMYTDLGPTTANIAVGILSAIVDNIPVMVAVLSMQPEMGLDQWLLVTLTAGTGGSLLSIGSAAGVALMGVARGYYTFGRHLIWSPVILLGYIAGIATHLYLNG